MRRLDGLGTRRATSDEQHEQDSLHLQGRIVSDEHRTEQK